MRRLVDAARRREPRYKVYSEETLEGEAREVLGLYYSRWGNRFQVTGGVMHPSFWSPDRVPDATPDEPELEGLIISPRYWTASPEPELEVGTPSMLLIVVISPSKRSSNTGMRLDDRYSLRRIWADHIPVILSAIL